MTTIVKLRGGGEEGLGEDVTYMADLHDDVPVPDVAGSWTLESFFESLEGFPFFADPPEDNAAYDYRRWAWESAALDLALSQAGLSLGDAVGRVARPVRYVVSTRVTNVEQVLELYPEMHFKLDPGPDWSDETIDRLAELACVDTADFKGVYRGSFGQPPNPRLYRRIAEAFPDAWLEDPALDEPCGGCSSSTTGAPSGTLCCTAAANSSSASDASRSRSSRRCSIRTCRTTWRRPSSTSPRSPAACKRRRCLRAGLSARSPDRVARFRTLASCTWSRRHSDARRLPSR